MEHVIDLVFGALILGTFLVALFFAKYWRDTRDRFFAYFASAFAVLAVHWAVLALTDPKSEHRPLFYLMRLAAFLLIVIAIVEKNRASR